MDLQKKYTKALDFLRSNQFSEAKKIFQQILRKKPTDVFSIESLAKITLEEGHLEHADTYLTKLAALTDKPDVLQNIIILNYDLHNYDKCSEYINQVTIKDQNNLIANLYKAKILLTHEKFDEAAGIFESLHDIYTENVLFLTNYAFALNKSGRYGRSIEINKILLLKDPKNADTFYNIGIAYENLNNDSEAEASYMRSIEIDNFKEPAYLNLSSLYLKLKKHEQSKKILHELLNINKNSHTAYFMLGYLASMENKLEDSIAYFNNSLAHHPSHAKSHLHLGLSMLRLGMYDKFAQHYKWRSKDADEIRASQMKFDDFEVDFIDKNSNLLIHYDQGIGDQIFFSRFIKYLEAKQITLVVNKKIKSFLKKNLTKINIIDSEQEKDISHVDFKKINLSSVMRFIKHTDFLKEKSFRPDSGNKISKKNDVIGLSWRSKSGYYGDSKSFSIHDLLKVINRQELQFINLQYGEVADELQDVFKHTSVIVNSDENKNITDEINDLAEVIKKCDIVVTCSNVTAHVAGVMRKKTYLLAPSKYGRLWFWDADDSGHSVWYPSVKIISNEEDNWNIVFEQLNKYLIKL